MGHQTFLVFQIKTYIVFEKIIYIIIKMLCHIVIALVIAFCKAAPHPPGHHYYKTHHQPMWRKGNWKPMKMAQPEVPVVRAASKDVVDVAVGAGAFDTLVKIVSDLGLVDTLKGAEALTVFAPSDEAFAKLPAGTLESLTPDQAKEIVLRHVVTAKVPAAAVTIGGELIGLVKTANGGVQINYKGGVSNVVTADVQASNGVIHVIDNVILPAAPKAAPAPLGDVVDVAVGAGAFKTLVKIVSDLGLVDTLKAAKEVTIFAPSDDAFAQLPAGTLESLTADQAKAIVLRHVVAAKVPASVVVSGNVRTFGNEMIELVKTRQGGVQIRYNGGVSNVVTADVNASNGVIHVIDKVIL